MTHPTDEELDALVRRLTWHREHVVTGKLVYANEDGPDAADAITALRAQLAEVEAKAERRRRMHKSLAKRYAIANARADRADAERAAQIERDAGIALKHRNNLNALTSLPPQSAAAWDIYNEIRAQPHDRTALDRMLAEAREKVLHEAADLADTSINKGGLAKSMAFFLRAEDYEAYRKACEDYQKAIIELIEKPREQRENG